MGIRDRVGPPPSSATGELGNWLLQVWQALNATPRMSYFSGTTPNSLVTGLAGDLAVNIGSASTGTRTWQKGGSSTVPDMNDWVPFHIGPA